MSKVMEENPDNGTVDQAEEIFCAAYEHAAGEDRDAFLDRTCAGDSGLRARVESMLSTHETGARLVAASRQALTVTAEVGRKLVEDPYLQRSLGLDAGMEELVGNYIGPYRLVEVLGEGGGGVVHLAEQEFPVRRKVALKIIKLGMDTRSVIARFEAERQALAMMDHPNIARVLDAGATASGRPFFVMDLVRGEKITRFCDQERLNVPQRLELFIQVCAAIQHAHQKGIIHRDIKPSNVLVTTYDGVARPMVIDFGIATAVEGRLSEGTVFTCLEQFIGTPAYMSPEQARRGRLDVDTRSDIYSLGVLLCELLTGKAPFDGTDLLAGGIDCMLRTLLDTEAPRPSALLKGLPEGERREISECRREAEERLVARLRGDLDWIVIKALEKDRDRRYQTANGLAMDVRRHLEGEPVLARPPSRSYRLKKLVGRNKLAFALGAVAAISLIGGLAGTSVLLVRERDLRKEQARLRIAAERGLEVEGHLRRQAEWREGLAQAATLIYRNEFEEADRLVAGLPRPPPVSEGAFVLRTLGEWNALRGHWSAAAERFQSLLSANQLDNLDSASLDLLATAVSIINSGEEGLYSEFCWEVAGSFQGTDDPMVVDRVLKGCLLRSAPDSLLTALDPYADLVASVTKEHHESANERDLLWRRMTMALWALRSGRVEAALVWVDLAFAGGEHPPSRSAGTRAIRALALHRLGRVEDALVEFEVARRTVRTRIGEPLVVRDSSGGFWFDWTIAEILVNEAARTLGQDPVIQR